ncbi:hypothetical protein INS49_015291 [Diaporthe citri]|uniref:uncharacterized protein n=1 Tax=Diaporthe citri TaxID=83186 RepID=UPI001C7E23DF|nr:uncharacterized protein INS49_015291 [Diaporthe citri]KAG6355907.1 hypothetical protein INS49_015291 [Diaporthe citri]
MQRLSEFGQASLRTYTQIVLAFPLSGRAPASTIYQHLRASLTRLGNSFPLLASEVHLKKSRFGEEAFILPPSSSGIPLWTEISDTNYADLAARGFPAQNFIHPDLDLNNTLNLNEGPVPVAHVRVKLIDGGFLLFLSLHHTLGDAYCLGLFAQAFAAATRGERIAVESSSPELHLPQDEDISSSTLLTLSRHTPEYEVLLNSNSGPSLPDILPGGIPSEEIPGVSKIFALKIDDIEQLRNKVRDVWGPVARKPSAFTCMAALTWAHVTKARIASEPGIAPPSENANIAKLFTLVDFRRRFHDETEEYFGNANVTVPTETSVEDLDSACEGQDVMALAKIVARITTTFSNVDQTAILRREALFKRITDYRRLALSQDRRIPGQLQFNSWRYFGGNDVWKLPGVGTKKPDSVRRVQGEVSLGNVLILPLNSESEVYEISVQIPEMSMSALLQDDGWMHWVHHTIG